MATGQLSRSEVKAIENELECSPSQHDSSGNFGGKPNIGVTDKNSKTHSGGESTSEFKMSDRGRPLPNFKGQFAKKAPQF